MMFGIMSFAQPVGNREYRIKAAFLFNFTQFVDWPPTVLPQTGASLVIGILGENPFGKYLDEMIAGETANGHPLEVHLYKNVDEIEACHILFINLPQDNKLKEALATLKGRSILTVSDENNFIHLGGMIRFVTKQNKIQIEIAPERAKDADLIISSKLLNVAEIVSPDNDKDGF